MKNINSLTDSELIDIHKLLIKPIDDLELSVRTHNCLEVAGITLVGHLIAKDESEMLTYKNFGRKCLNELIEKLEAIGLGFGMDIDFDENSIKKRYHFAYKYNKNKSPSNIPNFFNSIELKKLSLFLQSERHTSSGFFVKNSYKAHNGLIVIAETIPDIITLKEKSGGEEEEYWESNLLNMKGFGRKKLNLLLEIMMDFYKNFDDLIGDLTRIGCIDFSNILCSNNLIRFFEKNGITDLEKFVQVIDGINFTFDYKDQNISDADALALFEMLTINLTKKENIYTSATSFSKNKNLIQSNFIEDFDNSLSSIDKDIFRWRFIDGWNLQKIADKHDLTRERVRQICVKLIVAFQNMYFVDSVSDIEGKLIEKVLLKAKPLTIEDLNMDDSRSITMYANLFPNIPFKDHLTSKGSLAQRGKITGYLSTLEDFSVHIKDIYQDIGIKYIQNIFLDKTCYFDDEGYLYRAIKVTSAIDIIIRSVTEPTSVNEFRSYIFSNSIFESVLNRDIFGKHFASQIGGNQHSILLNSMGQSLDDQIYGTINMISYQGKDLKRLHKETIKILKQAGRPMSAVDLYNILILKFKKIKSKYELAVMLKLSDTFVYTHRTRAFIFSLKEHGKVKQVQEHFEDILLEINRVTHISEIEPMLSSRTSFRKEGLPGVQKRNKNVIAWGAGHYGHRKNIESDRALLKNDIEYISKIIGSRNREKYFKLLYPGKKLSEIDLGELLDG